MLALCVCLSVSESTEGDPEQLAGRAGFDLPVFILVVNNKIQLRVLDGIADEHILVVVPHFHTMNGHGNGAPTQTSLRQKRTVLSINSPKGRRTRKVGQSDLSLPVREELIFIFLKDVFIYLVSARLGETMAQCSRYPIIHSRVVI